MCGIAGIVSKELVNGINNKIKNMNDKISHRGPDDEGYFLYNSQTGFFQFYYAEDSIKTVKERSMHIASTENLTMNVALAHRRLSIIDLTEDGHQPIFDKDSQRVIVFNGEIYNYKEIRKRLEEKKYKFNSLSDTEVILKAYDYWKEDCLDKFNGMWAFVIYDLKENKVFASRDRMGIKPFYYHYKDGFFSFSSEIKSLLEDGIYKKEVNKSVIADYVLYQFSLNQETFFKDIYSLEAGSYLTFKLGENPKISKFWDIPACDLETKSEEEWTKTLREMLKESVLLRMESDVPLGAHLSGGVDSSSVVSICCKMLETEQVEVFNGRFDELPYDESAYAKQVANICQASYNPIDINYKNFSSELIKLIAYMDEPKAGPGIYPQYMVSKVAREKVTVILGGQGGDELFGGYDWQKTLYLFDLMKLSKTKFLKTYFQLNPIRRSSLMNLKFLWNNKHLSVDEFYSVYWIMLSGINQLDIKIFTEDFSAQIDQSQSRFLEIMKKEKGILNKMKTFDLKYWLESLLQIEDRTSMISALESRVPLIDYNIVELSTKIPFELKHTSKGNKYLLKKAMRGIVPDIILDRKDKKGFPTPIHDMFKQNNYEIIDRYILENDFLGSLFNKAYIESQVQSYKMGDVAQWRLIWKFMNLSIWHEVYFGDAKDV